MTPKTKTQEENLPPARKITAKQREFLHLVQSLRERDEVSPTLAELAQAQGVTKSTAAAYVRRLKAAGYLVQPKGKFRSIRPAASAAELAS